MPLIATNGIETHYEVVGDGIPVVFCHGLAGHCERELPWARSLAERGYQVVVYSARGHGLSTPIRDPASYTFELFRCDLEGLLDHLGFETAVLGGGSMGAAITLSYTLNNPARVRSLMQFGPAFGSQPISMVAGAFNIFADMINERGPDEAIDLLLDRLPLFADMARDDPGLIQDMRDQWNSHDRDSIVAAMKGVPADHPFDDIAALRSISIPTLIVAAPGDPIHPLTVAEEYHELIAGSRLEVVDLSPPLYRTPDRMASLMADFLATALA